MIELYSWGTPNGKKVPIFLEEAGLEYELHKVDLGKGEQRAPAYLAKNPNGKIPTLVDGDVTIWESGAILIHLAETTGKFLPKDGQARAQTLAWLMLQMASVGPMCGQLGYFRRAGTNNTEAIMRYESEVKRLYGVLESGLVKSDYLAGDYSIADMAMYPWVAGYAMLGIDMGPFPRVKKWVDRIGDRPAVKKAMAVFG